MCYLIDRKWHGASIHQSILQSILETRCFKRHNVFLSTSLCSIVACSQFYVIQKVNSCLPALWPKTKKVQQLQRLCWCPDSKAVWLATELLWSLLVLKQPWHNLYLEVCLMGWREAELPLYGLLTITISISLGWETATRDRLWQDC